MKRLGIYTPGFHDLDDMKSKYPSLEIQREVSRYLVSPDFKNEYYDVIYLSDEDYNKWRTDLYNELLDHFKDNPDMLEYTNKWHNDAKALQVIERSSQSKQIL